ncbi:hypothetical protein [Paenirhodobacter sp.]|uniref:hypothetical protein n=1 Tax=Paenirhodobacter sp. TaxID=1965326 RepID=UPI003B3DC4B5
MPDIDPEELALIQSERARIFSPGWFADLLSGRLGFGDTFWLGIFGILLFVVPVGVLVSGLIYARAQEGVMPFLRIVCGAMGLWRICILRALLIARRRTGARGAWPVIGLIWTVIDAASLLWYSVASA